MSAARADPEIEVMQVCARRAFLYAACAPRVRRLAFSYAAYFRGHACYASPTPSVRQRTPANLMCFIRLLVIFAALAKLKFLQGYLRLP